MNRWIEASRWPLAVLAVGLILFVPSSIMFSQSLVGTYPPPSGPLDDPNTIGHVFDGTKLIAGIILALVGTAMVSAALPQLLRLSPKRRP